MEKDIRRFRGSLNGRFKDEINKKLVDYMIDIGLVIKFNKFTYTVGSKNELTSPFIFNDQSYHFNKDVFLDIYQYFEWQLTCNPRHYKPRVDLKKLRIELKSKLNKEQKLQFLKKAYTTEMMKLEYIDTYESYEKHIANPIFDNTRQFFEQKEYCWKASVINEFSYDNKLIESYLVQENFLNSLDMYSMTEYGGFKCKNWNHISCTHFILEFIKNELDKLVKENESNIDSSNLVLKNSTQKMILLNRIINSDNWSDLTPNMKGKILEPLLGHHKDTIIKAIDVLDPKKSNATKNSLDKDIKEVEYFLKKLGVSLGDLTG